MKPDVAKLVCFGNGTDVVYYGHGTEGSGYGSPERPHAAQIDDGCAIPDGTPAIDKRPAIATAAGYSWVFKGPMVNPDIPDGKIDRCPDLAGSMVAQAIVSDPGNGYAPLIVSQLAHRGSSAGPLDSVSISEYVRGWKAVGARIGRYQSGQIVWEN
jgi:hypothetical protein